MKLLLICLETKLSYYNFVLKVSLTYYFAKTKSFKKTKTNNIWTATTLFG